MGAHEEIETAAGEFGDRLRKARKAAGLSQEQLAILADISPVTLSKLENGRSLPTLKAFIRLAIALKETPNDLLGWANSAQAPVKSAHAALVSELTSSLDELSPEWLEAMTKVATLAQQKRR